MSDKRKLNAEIDRCLKKVAEGVIDFEGIWEKVNSATSTNQKEKYECDLKKEIKKLQRLRDQIKTWLSSPEIKEKRTSLMETRRLIEMQMEKFKVIERETKTKAFSKEGLVAASKVDPNEEAKEKAVDWINSCTERLNIQIDTFEAEIEKLLGRKKKNFNNERIEKLKQSIRNHREHEQRLETVLRYLMNEKIDSEDVFSFKEDLEYYIDSNQEKDFVKNEDIYDRLGLIESDEELIENKQMKEEIDEEDIKKTDQTEENEQNQQEVQETEKNRNVPIKEVKKNPSIFIENEEKKSKQFNKYCILPDSTSLKQNKTLEGKVYSLNTTNEKSPIQVSSPKKEEKLSDESNIQTSPPKEFSSIETNQKRSLDSNLLNILSAFNQSYQQMPTFIDSEKIELYVPRNPYIVSMFYPQQPSPLFQDINTFSKFKLETLFFIFYFQSGTKQQFYAASELKKQSWRFHSKYYTWFQRCEDSPREITNEFEKGTYLYFDFENDWIPKKKFDFVFEYKYLED